MLLETRFEEGDVIFCLDKRGSVKERTIMGIRTQSLFGKQKTNYSFVKDGIRVTQDYLQMEQPMYIESDFFWLPEDKVYDSIEELKNNL